MKNTKFLIFLLCFIAILSCKKDSNINKEKDSTINIYENTPNKEDGLLADVYDVESNYKTYFYGSFNDKGKPKNVRSIVLENKNTDTLCNYLLDDNNRIYLSYESLKNGTKLNRVIKVTYTESDSAFLNIYDYNWTNNTDSLIEQIVVHHETESSGLRLGQVTNGDDDDLTQFQKEIEDIKKKFEKNFLKGVITVDGVLLAICAGVAIYTTGGTMSWTCPSFVALTTALIFFTSSKAPASTIPPNINFNVPASPTAEATTIPNPIGTPGNPNGKMGTVTFYVPSCYSGCIGSCGYQGASCDLTIKIYKDESLVSTGTVKVGNLEGWTVTLPEGNYSFIFGVSTDDESHYIYSNFIIVAGENTFRSLG